MYSEVSSIVYICVLLSIVPQTFTLSLYSPDDPLHELDNTNFESVLFGKSHAWIIEFYNNWCGHCVRFAPKWKQFARDIRTWRNVIDVAVVNCAEVHNIKLCRDYSIESYPTIKLFKPFVNESDKGALLTGDRDIESMESTVVKFLESYQDQNSPADWPDLHPLESTTVSSVMKLLKDNEGPLVLFIEHEGSVLGKKVIMDLSFQSSIIVQRILMSNEELLNDLKSEVQNSSLATVIRIDKNGKKELLFRFSSDVNSTYVRDKIFKHFVGYHRSESEQVLGSKTNSNIKVSIRDSVHMTDLENALRYLLYQEIGVVKYIYGDRLLALKAFLSTLKNYFPGKPQIIGYITKVNDWVSKQKNITGEEFVRKLDELQTDDEYLPEMKDYIGCRGSEPRYRGYPCSLWTLFHTLTVQAYIADEETAGGMHEDVITVLPNIKGYIKYFFTCEECVQNFQKMDQNIDRDANTSSNVALWLWAAHNKVNRRLSGDITEDPQHPKIQFPSPNMCPNCRLKDEESDDIKWDEVQVLRFLRHFYGKQNIVLMEDNSVLGSKERHQSDYTVGNSSTGIKYNQYPVLILLLWLLHYTILN